MGLQGKYYSEILATTGANEDLIEKIKTSLGLTKMLIKKLTLICSATITIDINELGIYSDLFTDTDGYTKLSLSADDIMVYSLKVKESSITDIFLAIIYQ